MHISLDAQARHSQLDFYAHAKSRAWSRAGITISCGAAKKYSSTYQHQSSRIADSTSAHAKCSFYLKRVSTPPRALISTGNQHGINVTMLSYDATNYACDVHARDQRLRLNLHANIGSICGKLLHLCGKCLSILHYFKSLLIRSATDRYTCDLSLKYDGIHYLSKI